MKKIAVSNVIEVLNMSIQAGFIAGNGEISASSRVVERISKKFLEECIDVMNSETKNIPKHEVKEVTETLEAFIYALVENPYADFRDKESDLALTTVELTRVLGGLKSIVKSIW